MNRRLFILATIGIIAGAFVVPRDFLTPDAAAEAATNVERTRMFRVRLDEPLTLRIPPYTDEVRLDVVATVEYDGPYNPRTQYHFTLVTEARFDGQTERQRLALRSRVSRSSDGAHPFPQRGSRVVGVRLDSTDSRSVALRVPAAMVPVGGSLQVQALAGNYRGLYLRPFGRRSHLYAAEEVEGELDGPSRRRYAQVGTALGPDDFNEELWARVASERVFRLVPTRAGVTTHTVELMKYRRPLDDTTSAQLACEPEQWIALNTRGPAVFNVTGPPGTEIRADGATPSSARFPDDGHLEFVVDNNSPQTLVVFCPSDFVVIRIGCDEEDTPNIGPARIIEGADQVQLLPDLRRIEYTSLVEPLRFPASDEERVFRLDIRRLLDDASEGANVNAEIRVGSRIMSLEQWAERSMFERVEGHALSEAHFETLLVPAGEELAIYGSETTMARAKIYVEDIVEELDIRYPEPHGMRWRFAPHDLSPWAHALPENFDAIRLNRRTVLVRAQVRLEATLALAEPAQAPPENTAEVAPP